MDPHVVSAQQQHLNSQHLTQKGLSAINQANPYSDALSDSASPATQLSTGSMPSGGSSPSHTSPTPGAESRVPPNTVPAACLACRGKHLKCDGQVPCSRCSSSNSECIYVASRRGYKGPRKGAAQNPNKRHASSPPTETGSQVDIFSAEPTCRTVSNQVTSFSPAQVSSEAAVCAIFNSTPNQSHSQLYRPQNHGAQPFANNSLAYGFQNRATPAQVPVPSLSERCIDAFYQFFHKAHPFVLPKEHLLRLAKGSDLGPLLAAVQWVGSLYMDVGPARAGFFEEALRLAYEITRQKDGFLIQTLLLLVIGLDGSGRQDKAREILTDAEALAVQISLNSREFAIINGRGDDVLEESWRRTWWDFYVVDGMIAGTHRVTNFLLFDIHADVALPCEEYEYLSGNIPQPMYLEDLEDRDFSGDDRPFSSFAYRILSARNLGKLMRTPPIFGPEDENLARIEALLTNWRLHLPQCKKDAIGKDGHLDEMMFQAHMMMLATSILLHQPHSQLDTSPTRAVNSCAPHRPVPSGDFFNSHTKHTIQSANEISRLVTHRVPLLSHTHFFGCVISLSSIVHLSKWALNCLPQDDDDLRQQIRLNTGALVKMAQVWESADNAAAQVKGVAQEVYRMKKQQQMTPQFWLGFSQEEVLHSIAADDSIISDIETMDNLSNVPNLLG